jgi:hypothetical protein
MLVFAGLQAFPGGAMTHGSSDRVPASSLILLASIFFTITAYFIFSVLWEVAIPILWLGLVLGLQLATLLLGSSKVLTQLGAASLSALMAVAACIGTVFLVFPPTLELRIAGAVGGGTALVFILASFVAASKADPIPSRAGEPIAVGNLEDDQTVELIKYGEVKAPEGPDEHVPLLDSVLREESDVGGPSVHTAAELPPNGEDNVYEFDELSESKLGFALGSEDRAAQPDPLDLDEESVTKLLDKVLASEKTEESLPEPEPDLSDEPAIPEEWVEEAAKSMAYDAFGDKTRGVDTVTEENGERPVINENAQGFGLRTRFKVLDAESGEHFGTYYGDEGYSTLDTDSLADILAAKPAHGELRIVKLDWSNFDEVEVHIKVEEVVPIDLDADVMDETGEEGIFPLEGEGQESETGSDAAENYSQDELAIGSMGDDAVTAAGPGGPRYMIYDRRTIQPLGEYVPEGDRPRIDRLTLYRLFPEYDFKTFEIDSIRWETDEVRIFIKGEKKEKKGSGV